MFILDGVLSSWRGGEGGNFQQINYAKPLILITIFIKNDKHIQQLIIGAKTDTDEILNCKLILEQDWQDWILNGRTGC